MSTEDKPAALASTEGLGLVPEPAGFRTRYRSEPGMIGHYPWTYADQQRRRVERPECEYEDLYTAEQLRAAVAAERERCAKAEAKITRLIEWMTEQGLLHYNAHCKRPDGSSGPAWVVRKPASVWGDACEAWHATCAAAAVDAWLSGPNVQG